MHDVIKDGVGILQIENVCVCVCASSFYSWNSIFVANGIVMTAMMGAKITLQHSEISKFN